MATYPLSPEYIARKRAALQEVIDQKRARLQELEAAGRFGFQLSKPRRALGLACQALRSFEKAVATITTNQETT